MITIVHGGQTGVDRGAHEAARVNGWKVGGYMPFDEQDELGTIPPDVSRFLLLCRHKGHAARTKANLHIAHALLVIVEDTQNPYATPGTKLTLAEARKMALPRLVVDPHTHVPTIGKWIHECAERVIRHPRDMNAAVFHLMVAGPRASKWMPGQLVTRSLLVEIRNQVAL